MQDRPPIVRFERVARLPAAGDNVAIATRRLEAGSVIRWDGVELPLRHTVLEGHRFAVEPIPAGSGLLSWGLPFGTASRDIVPGEYVCNARILAALALRDVDVELPLAPNFADRLEDWSFDPDAFTPGVQVSLVREPGSFRGYRRPGDRGVGTRNHILVLAASARANGFATAVAKRFHGIEREHPDLDGVVAVTHTEGAGGGRPNNHELIRRALAGFVTHPNVAGALIVDYPADDPVSGAWPAMDLGGDRHDGMPRDVQVLERAFGTELESAVRTITGWLPAVTAARRTQEPLSALTVALQCGGSDAFSGVSGNALAGWVAKLLLRHGGSSVIAETDELIGAEAYVLRNVRDLETAQRLLDRITAFKRLVANHGASAEANPTGGNNLRGLYNIALKSLGAARKFDPGVRLDHVIDYAEPLPGPGCTFMDSPGNDLESIAGQVAAGANLIFFTTGNGSITNFPFVPTLKFVTTTGRFDLLADEMDVNAGRYNDGESMDALGDEVLELTRAVASGQATKGERAGHAQVQLWRDWAQADDRGLVALTSAPPPVAVPLAVRAAPPSTLTYRAFASDRGPAVDRVGLVMPTSLCSGQIARLIAEDLTDRPPGAMPLRRYIALVHTEGCGSANTEDLFLRTLAGYLRHRSVAQALLLEHGCEKTHNDAVRHHLADQGVDAERLGWASIQVDGGIGGVGRVVRDWFRQRADADAGASEMQAAAASLTVGLFATGELPPRVARSLAELACGLVAAGGTVIVPAAGVLAEDAAFRAALLADDEPWRTTVRYGEPPPQPGLHVMDAPTLHATELTTGLGGAGADVIVACVSGAPVHAHPLVPVIQVSGTEAAPGSFADDLDVQLAPSATSRDRIAALEARIAAVASREVQPRLAQAGMVDFQLTRGRLGVST